MTLTARQPSCFTFPDVDRAAGILFLKAMEELRSAGQLYTASMVSLLWHAVIVLQEISAMAPDELVLRTHDGKLYRITKQPKVSDETLRWLATVHPQDFVYTLLCSVSSADQQKIIAGWTRNPNEKPQIVAGLKRWQDEFKTLLERLVAGGHLKFAPQLLRKTA